MEKKTLIHLADYAMSGGIVTYCNKRITLRNGKWLESRRNLWVETGALIGLDKKKVTCNECLNKLALEEKQ